MGWLPKTFEFTADGSSTTIEFYSLDAGDTGPALDQVLIQQSGPPVGLDPLGPAGFSLAPPWPNPAPDAFQVAFSVPFDTRIQLSVFDVRGRELVVLAEGIHRAGRHALSWDGGTARGRAGAGLYFIRLTAPGVTLVRRAVLSQ
jgi:hypothetical protein